MDVLPVMRMPRTVDIELTSNCNLRCRYCYFFNNQAVEYLDLPTDEWLQFFDELGSLGVMNVSLAGGEPFTRKDLPILLDGIVRNRMRFSLLTNGMLIDDDIAAFIAKTGRCEYIQVSLDGSRPETHDPARGKGSFEKAVKGIKTLQRYGILVAVRTTIHKHNVYELEDITKFVLEDLGITAYGTNSAGYLGTCRLNTDEILLTTAERQLAMETLVRLNKKYDGRIMASAGPLDEGRRWGRMEQARAESAPRFSNGGYLTGCGCTAKSITVRADGAIVPCSMLAHIAMGRINRDSLADIWRNHTALDNLRGRRIIPLSNFEHCSGCQYEPYCTGNCPGLAYTMTGEVNHPSPDACLRLFLADGGQLDGILK